MSGWRGCVRWAVRFEDGGVELGNWQGDVCATKTNALRDAWGYSYRRWGFRRTHELVNGEQLVPYYRPEVDGS